MGIRVGWWCMTSRLTERFLLHKHIVPTNRRYEMLAISNVHDFCLVAKIMHSFISSIFHNSNSSGENLPIYSSIYFAQPKEMPSHGWIEFPRGGNIGLCVCDTRVFVTISTRESPKLQYLQWSERRQQEHNLPTLRAYVIMHLCIWMSSHAQHQARPL